MDGHAESTVTSKKNTRYEKVLEDRATCAIIVFLGDAQGGRPPLSSWRSRQKFKQDCGSKKSHKAIQEAFRSLPALRIFVYPNTHSSPSQLQEALIQNKVRCEHERCVSKYKNKKTKTPFPMLCAFRGETPENAVLFLSSRVQRKKYREHEQQSLCSVVAALPKREGCNKVLSVRSVSMPMKS